MAGEIGQVTELPLGWGVPVAIDERTLEHIEALAHDRRGPVEAWQVLLDSLGEDPAELTADQADNVRTLLGETYPDTGGSPARIGWSVLRGVFLPPPDECAETRVTIKQAGNWISNIDHGATPDPVDFQDDGSWDEMPPKQQEEITAAYNAFVDSANDNIEAAETAFNTKPAGCEMTADGDLDVFDCYRCNFHSSVDSSSA